MRFSVTLDGEAFERLRVRAVEEQRSTASMAARLIRDGLGVRLAVPAAAMTGSDVLRDRPSRTSSVRSGMCEHRVPADQFCKRCDG